MSNIFQIGVSGLLSYQSALATVSNNISNSNDENYNRQRTEFVGLPSQQGVGSGVTVAGVQRIFDRFLTNAVFANQQAASRLDAMTQLGAQIDSLLTNADSGVSAGMQNFFEALSTLTTDPSSLASREATLGAAQSMVNQFQALDTRFRELEDQIDQRMSIAVSDLNSLAESVADLNRDIARLADGQGNGPSDLLDRRDAILKEMSRYTNVKVAENGDGTVNVLIGNGVTLVRGLQADRLAVTADPFDPQRLAVTLDAGAGAVNISGALKGGELGGLMDFRDEILTPARNELGGVAYALFSELNAQQRNGMTLDGRLGEDLFALGNAVALVRDGSSPGLTVDAAVSNPGALTGQEYELRYTGGAWEVRDSVTDRVVPSSGSGTAADPLLVGGVSVTLTGAAVGDRVLLRPTGEVIADLELLAFTPASLAVAAPVVGEASLNNIGDVALSGLQVDDVSNPDLLNTVTLTFLDANTYSVDGGPGQAYVPGDPISLNGYSFVLDGAAAAGDTFTIRSNASGTGDNRNGLRLLGVRDLRVLDGGTSSVEAAFDNMVTGIASENRSLNLSRDAQASLLLSAEQERLNVSGVNLDEEAADLLRFQQAYSASAEVVRVAGELFDTLLGAVA